VFFLSDWQRLWMFFKNDEIDEVARDAPLFYMCTKFFFHRATVRLMYFLFTWNFILTIILNYYFPRALSSLLLNNNFLTIIFQLALYLCACMMNQGRLPKFFRRRRTPIDQTTILKNQQLQQQAQAQLDRDSTNYDASSPAATTNRKLNHHLPWRTILRQLFLKSWSEIKEVISRVKKETDEQSNFSTKGMYYYRWMNMSLKLLSRYNGVEIQELNFNKNEYRFMLLFTLFLFPLLVIYSVYQTYGYNVFEICSHQTINGDDDINHPHHDEHQLCNYFFYRMIGSIGCITFFLSEYIFAGSILVSLVGLAYGGEIAYRLADCWLQKYGCLRRVSQLDSCYIFHDYFTNVVPSSSSSTVSAAAAAVSAVTMNNHDTVGQSRISMISQSQQSIRQQRSAAAAPERKNPEEDDGQGNGLSHSSSSFSQRINLRTEIGEEYHVLDGFHYTTNVVNKSKLSEKEQEKLQMMEQASTEICECIKRDAIEQYLFIQETMTIVGNIWSPVLTGLFVLTIYLSASEIYYLLFERSQHLGGYYIYVEAALYVFAWFIFLVIYPICSIAFANFYLLKISENFKLSAKEDYQVIGGQEEWLELFEKYPVVWTYYGIYITGDRLAGLLWTVVLSFASILFTALSNINY
jgi:hypothetical protein